MVDGTDGATGRGAPVVHVVLPDGVDDPTRPSGGNVYDRRLCDVLASRGWAVREHVVAGGWPAPEPSALRALGAAMAAVPDGEVVLVDGLIASAAADVLVAESRRVRLVVLLHMLLGEVVADPVVSEGERAVLAAADAVVATSRWTRERALDRHGLDTGRVHVAEPGTDSAAPVAAQPAGTRLICVAALTPNKGHDVLLDALATLTDLPWTLTLVGSPAVDPAYADLLQERAAGLGLTARIDRTGPLVGRALDAAWSHADALVLATRGETYGMVVTESLARGLPVIASRVGGLPLALGHAGDGSRPGLLVPPDDPGALAVALRHWLEDADLRARLRSAAASRRTTLTGWDVTATRVVSVLDPLVPAAPNLDDVAHADVVLRDVVLPQQTRSHVPDGVVR
jgi:glycosyltransferase involved in cell wall biosynthesis